MKKFLRIFILPILAIMFVASACGGSAETEVDTEQEDSTGVEVDSLVQDTIVLDTSKKN